jgi:Domain of unknown function (DUF6429)
MERTMNFDDRKVDETVLAVLYLTLHDGNRVWKTLDFGTMDRLHEQRLISDPAVRARSVMLTEEGLAKAVSLANKLFAG